MAVAQKLRTTHASVVDERVRGVVTGIDERVAGGVSSVDDGLSRLADIVTDVDDGAKVAGEKLAEPLHGAEIIYQEQLAGLYRGIALWHPNPVKHLYDCGQVSIGDVGYLYDGDFIRMFNVLLPWDDSSNEKLGKPDEYKPLEFGPFVTTRGQEFFQTEYYSRNVDRVENVQAGTSDE